MASLSRSTLQHPTNCPLQRPSQLKYWRLFCIRSSWISSTSVFAVAPSPWPPMSEIESRQYVTFQRQPPGRWYCIDDSGVFKAGSPRHTTQFQPEARILSVGIEAAARR